MIDRRTLIAGGAALAALPGSALNAALPIPAGNKLGFDILRKGSKLGTHALAFQSQGDALTVQVAVELIYKIGFVTLYHYTHHATERWVGDQVVAIQCATDDNGSKYEVSVKRDAAGLTVTGPKGLHYVAPANAMPATHWNRRELDGPWINTQDGKLMKPKVTPGAIEAIPAVGGTIRAKHYALTGDVQMDMFYDDRGWAGLSFVKSGALVQYLRQA